MKIKYSLVLLLGLALLTQCKPGMKQKLPLINEQVIFLYYTNMQDAENFYANVLQFRKTYDDDWVKIFRSNTGAAVGIVDMLKTGYTGDAEKQLMLSFRVSNIKGWYAYMKTTRVKILRPLQEDDEAPIKAFLVEDPGGYKVEFFKWK